MRGMKKRNSTTEMKEWRRKQALQLKEQGWNYQEISQSLGVTKGAISHWMKRVEQLGEEGLVARPHTGSPAKLSEEQQRLLSEYLSHGAEAYGFRGEIWTSRRVAEVIEVEFGVKYHPATVTRLLKKLKWTPQQPLQYASQRDESEMTHWREQTWPKLKKKPLAKVEP